MWKPRGDFSKLFCNYYLSLKSLVHCVLQHSLYVSKVWFNIYGCSCLIYYIVTWAYCCQLADPANALWTVYCIQYEGFSAEEDWSSLDRPAVEFWQPYVYNVLRYNNLYRGVTKEDISGRDVFEEKKNWTEFSFIGLTFLTVSVLQHIQMEGGKSEVVAHTNIAAHIAWKN